MEADRGALLTAMQVNYTHLMMQAELRNQIEVHLITFIKMVLEKECFPGQQFEVQLYGSLHHGLYIPGISKVNVDISPIGPTVDVSTNHLLHVLTSHLQMLLWKGTLHHSQIQHPVLVWHRNATRPWLLMLSWDGTPVHITYCNHAAIQVSKFMLQTLAQYPYLRMTLLHWKRWLRSNTKGAQYMGPNTGQVSSYALFMIALSSIGEVNFGHGSLSMKSFEEKARQFTMAYLSMVPHRANTMDKFSENYNLTSRSFLAPAMAREMEKIPPLPM